ncbi:MAG TPA: hypothetical protein VHV78_15915 [Gemmatimonadaceae bacterium]|nr:hypothetical protein [Gemmatimonadaceae bacterium]
MTITHAAEHAAEEAHTMVDGVPVAIRPLVSNEDCRACVQLQREIWGFEVGDVVPASLVHVVSMVGGLAAGAFDASGTMLGFVFGVTGIRDGVLAHWSHMLGVRETVRNGGVGRMLKEYQRDALARIGVVRVYWTFDPLQAKNAYFNLHRLGAHVDEYVPDMYGDTGSPLHLGLPTDRLIVHVRTAGRDVDATRLASDVNVPILTPVPCEADVVVDRQNATPGTVLIEMPADVMDVTSRSIDDARAWRMAVREHFRWAFENGYRATGAHRNPATGRSFYIMTRAGG